MEPGVSWKSSEEQGTFVGKSASGGAIFVRTNSPELNDMGGNLELGVGNHVMFETRGYLNASSSDTFAFRAAFNYENRDHYYDKIYGPYTGDPCTRDLKSLRLGMLWMPTDKILAGIEMLWGKREDNDGNSGTDFRMQWTLKFSFSSKDIWD